MRDYVMPQLGRKRVDIITTADACLKAIVAAHRSGK